MAKLKIGIFDSGIGGLTVAKAIKSEMPKASLVYFGDTAHLPYGDKSPASIRHYSAKITQFLLSHHCNALVIACNTASAHAFKTVKDIAGPDFPVFNVIDPVVETIATQFTDKKVGVIGTKGTIKTRVYPNRIKKANPKVKVASKSTPLLAPMIEEGFFNNTISRAVIGSYLGAKELKNIHALVLGCTHYPLIQKEVSEFFDGQVNVIDSASVVAKHVKSSLRKRPSETDEDYFFVSDYTKAFEESTQTFFGNSIHLDEVRIFD